MIIGGVVGAIGFLLLIAIVVVAIISYVVYRLKNPPRIDCENHTDGPTDGPTKYAVSKGM